MMEWLDAQLEALSAVVGFPADQLALILCLLINYPLGFAFLGLLDRSRSSGKSKPSPPSQMMISLRHLYSAVPTILVSSWLLGIDTLHSLISSVLGYVILRLAARRSAEVGRIVFIYALIYVSASHIYSMYHSYLDYRMDFTRPQMLITIKLSTLAFNLGDAFHRSEEDLTSHEKDKRVKEVPGLLEFLGYIYFFPSFLSGPHIFFADYKRFIEGTLYSKEDAPSTVWPAFKKMGEAFLCLAIAAPVATLAPAPYTCHDDFANQSFVWKFFYVCIAGIGARFCFYFAWLLSEGAFIACGMGYNGKVTNPKTGKEEIKWDRVNNVDVLGWELGQSPRHCIASWNRQVQQWLYHYVYIRSFYTVEVFDEKTQKKIKIKKRPWYSTMLTNLLSAFWHGFYPGLYLGFGSTSVIIEVARILRTILRHHFVTTKRVAKKSQNQGEESPIGKAKEAKATKEEKDTTTYEEVEVPGPFKPLYDFASWFLTQASISLCMMPFIVLEFSCSIRIWNALLWWPHVGCAVILAASYLGLLRRFREPRASAPKEDASSAKRQSAKAE